MAHQDRELSMRRRRFDEPNISPLAHWRLIMNESARVVLSLIVSPILGIVAALITTQYKFKKERQREREKEQEHIRLKFLNPLLIASEDLRGRIIDIKRRRKDATKCEEMMHWFRDIKANTRQDKQAFGFWANDEGYFAMSTLYITAVYFHFASRIRRDFPFVKLESNRPTALLSRIAEVRTSIGGKFGIWEAVQDSLGTYLSDEKNGVKNYKDFCELIIDKGECIWFNRLVDFYRDVDKKLDDQLDNIEHSLKELIEFLNNNLHIERIEYRITDESIANLRERTIPKHVLPQLEPLKSQDYKTEADFVDALVSCIGQDMVDDYKPSILKCADRQLV